MNRALSDIKEHGWKYWKLQTNSFDIESSRTLTRLNSNIGERGKTWLKNESRHIGWAGLIADRERIDYGGGVYGKIIDGKEENIRKYCGVSYAPLQMTFSSSRRIKHWT